MYGNVILYNFEKYDLLYYMLFHTLAHTWTASRFTSALLDGSAANKKNLDYKD